MVCQLMGIAQSRAVDVVLYFFFSNVQRRQKRMGLRMVAHPEPSTVRMNTIMTSSATVTA